MRRLSTGGKGQEDPMSPPRPLPRGRGEVAPLLPQVAPVPTSFSQPGPSSAELPSRLRAARARRPWPRRAPRSPPLSQAQHPAGRGRLGARARCAPRAGRRARRGLTLRSPGQLQSNYGAPQVTCAGGAAGARIRERAAGTAAGEGRDRPEFAW